ncbi:MAG TPA: hypothetical protein VEL11_02515 [Candidatus Bathyarchaeia archaeon]|nr:hypothetical protein [Candidatus Bathyarchaeia archaeon]
MLDVDSETENAKEMSKEKDLLDINDLVEVFPDSVIQTEVLDN